MNLSAQSPFSSKVSQLLSWGHWFTFSNICLALLISLAYLFADTSPDTTMGSIYMILTWLGHVGFITFLGFVLTIFPLSLVFPYPRHIRGMAAILATFGASLMAFDAYVFYNLGYHLSSSALPQIVSLVWHTISASPIIATFSAGTLVITILSFELIVSNYTWKHLNHLKQLTFGKIFTGILLTSFALSHSIHIWADANFKFDITKQDNVLPLSYPTTAKSLLAKNNLLDLELYKQAKTEQLETSNAAYLMPTDIKQCPEKVMPLTDILIFNNDAELHHFLKAQTKPLSKIDLFLQPTSHEDSVFNLIYGLPAFYKKPILTHQTSPAWLGTQSIDITGFEDYRFISKNDNAAMKIIAANSNTQVRAKAEHIIAFALSSENKMPVTVSSVYINDESLANNTDLLQPMDLLATVLGQYWSCDAVIKQTLIGRNIYHQHNDSGINYTQGVFIAYKKDKITLIEADGSYKNISAAQGFLLDNNFDVPFLVESIKELKRFIGN